MNINTNKFLLTLLCCFSFCCLVQYSLFAASTILVNRPLAENIFIDKEVVTPDLSLNTVADPSVLHLFSHGRAGALRIEQAWKGAPAIADWLQRTALLEGKTHLNIYGCNFAQGAKGRAAVTYLEKELGIVVAASDDLTGVDGDWDLEVGQAKDLIKVPNYCYNLQTGTIPMQRGMAVVTCFSGADGNSPNSQDPNGFVMGIKDIRDPQGNSAPFPPNNWDNATNTSYHHASWIASNMGEVFGLALEEGAASAPDIFVTTTGVTREDDMNLYPRTGGTGGEVFRIDGSTGALSVLTTLPNTTYTYNRTGTPYSRYVGLGQIAYNNINDVLYVSNLDNGLVYVLNATTGATLATFDHNPALADNTSQEVTQPLRMVYGLAYNPQENRLYYGAPSQPGTAEWVIASELSVWSVPLNADGTIDATGKQLELSYSTSFSVISDISFSCDGTKMLIAEQQVTAKTSTGQYFMTRGAHSAHVFEYTGSTGSWSSNLTYEIGANYSSSIDGENAAGGVDYGFNNHGTNADNANIDDAIVATGDALVFGSAAPVGSIYGVQISPSGVPVAQDANGFPSDSHLVDVDGISGGSADKFTTGDVEVYGCSKPLLATLVDTTICEGSAFGSNSTTISVTNGIPATFQWYDNNGTDNPGTSAIAGQTTSTLTAPPTAIGSYSYRVIAANMAESACQDTITVNLSIMSCFTCTNPDLVTTPDTLCVGGSVDIATLVTDNANVGGTTAYYATLADATAQTSALSSTTVSPIVDTKYYVREDTTGCFDIDSMMIVVNNITAPIFSTGTTYCDGDDPTALTATTAASGDGTLTYQWQSNTTSCTGTFTDIGTGGTSATYDPPAITATTYYRVITTSTLGTEICMDTSDCITLTVNPNPTATAMTIAPTCPSSGTTTNSDGTLKLTSFPSGATYQYSTGTSFNTGAATPATATAVPADSLLATNLVNPAVGSTQDYTIRVYHNGCHVDVPVVLNSTDCSCTTPTADTPTTTPGACANTPANDATINISNITDSDIAGIVAGANYSSGVAYNADANTNAALYDASTGAITFTGLMHNTQYTIRLFNAADACFTDVTVTTSMGLVSPTITARDTTICNGQTIDVEILASTDIGTLTFHSANPPTVGNQLGSTSFMPTADSTIYLLATDGTCTITDSLTITHSIPDSIMVCDDASNSATITAQTGLTGVEWFNSAGTSVGTGNNVTIDANTTGLGDGQETFYYTATDGTGCAIGLCCPVVVMTSPCEVIDYLDYTDNCTNEPCHTISADIYLGAGVTAETSATSNATASGDTDDGVNIFSSLDVVAGGAFRLPITMYNSTGSDAYLSIFVDWNGNNDFGEVGDSTYNLTYPIGSHSGTYVEVINFNVPANLNTTQIGLRFRYSTDNSANATGACGTSTCAADGEVEDYIIPVICKPKVCLPATVTIRRGTRN